MGSEPDGHTGDKGAAKSSRCLHGTIADSLRCQVLEGSLAAMSRLPPMREIAATFDVSTMTVRRAIRTLEEEGYVYRIPAVGVFVRHPQNRLMMAKKMVTFVATDLLSLFEVTLARAIKKACLQRGWEVQIFERDTEVVRGRPSALRLAVSSSRGAIVMLTGVPQNVAKLQELLRTSFPLVLVDCGVAGIQADLVESDHEGAAYKATKHLIEKGHSCIPIVTPRRGVLSEEARIRGYAQALREAGIEASPDWEILIAPERIAGIDRKNERWRAAYEAALPNLRRFNPPFAVFAHNACTGWGVYRACEELGLRIPDDVSVVCIDDSDIARAMTPRMTAVAQRIDELGRVAVDLLMQRIQSSQDGGQGIKTFTHSVIDVDLVEGGSIARVG